ncbi:MAG: N-acetylmuramoyl-L-alanine amidase, partial [Cyanobacteria bacterium P01_D01_bin.56]
MAKHWSMVLGVVAPALTVSFATPAMAELFVAYPPVNHTTVSDKIFFIGTGSPDSDVLINGAPIAERSPAGHFAPSLPLAIGQNQFTLTQGNESIVLNITRNSLEPPQ